LPPGAHELEHRCHTRDDDYIVYADDVAPLLPAGTIIHITSWHDNTAANKYNPNPKNWVGSGQRTIDEMAFAWVSLTYLDQADFERRVAARSK